MNRAAVRASRSSVHLEEARLRLRERFLSKFFDTLTMKEPQPPPASYIEPRFKVLSSKRSNNEPLEEARLRIRQRFLEKFPFDKAVSSDAIGNQASAPNMANRSDEKTPEYLEQARLRIRERFQDKFPDFSAFPESVETLQHGIHDTDWGRANAIVVTSSTWPYPILGVNEAWEDLCGFTEDQVRGKTFHSLGITGDFTEADSIRALSKKLANEEQAAVHLTNATKDGTLFRNYLRVAPLYTKDEITHFVGVLQAQHQQQKL